MNKLLKFLFICVVIWFLLGFDTNWLFEEEIQCEELSGSLVTEQDERELKRLNILEQVESVVDDLSISTAIVDSCMNTTEDWYLCINNLIWVANAESSLFKRVSSSNNPFGLMYNWNLMRFNSIAESVYYWVQLYQKNQWFKRTNWADWLRGNYCTSQCTYWIANYNSWIAKLNLNKYY